MYFSGQSFLNPLNPPNNIVEVTNQDWISKVKDGLFDVDASYEGKIYGLPFGGVDFTGLLINESVFNDLSLTPPGNYEELISVSQAIKDAGITPIYEMGQQGGPLSAFTYVDATDEFEMDKQPGRVVCGFLASCIGQARCQLE